MSRPQVAEVPVPDAAALRSALKRRVTLHTPAGGAIAFTALPGKIDVFLEQLLDIFAALDRPFGDRDRAALRASLLERMSAGFRASPHAFVQVDYKTDDEKFDVVTWKIQTFVPPPEARYEVEGDAGQPPLLAPVPDARLLGLAADLGAPSEVRVLDVGAATGRNAFALARLGHPTDAVEWIATLADALEKRAASEGLPVRVVRGDFWDPALALPGAPYRLVRFTEIGLRLRGLTPVRGLLRRLAGVLEPGGAGLLHVFVARDGHVPDPATREFAEAMSCPVYTREELEDAAFGLPLRLESDESLLAYEREHLPEWPPAPWYPEWASGQHVFDLPEGAPPLELRWLVYRRT